MAYYCGIDIGASAAKLVLIDEQRSVVARSMCRSGVDYARSAQQCLEEAMAASGVGREEIAATLSTGYGRDNVPWARDKRTEIACHGKGAFHHVRGKMTIIDIGAQDSKVIHLDAEGHRTSFKMNRKCAAGTGAFLEEIAHRLDLDVWQLDELAQQSARPVALGSFCTVFAATEVLEKIRAGEKVEDIVCGAFRSVVKRILEMDAVDGTLAATGGVVAHNPCLVRLIGEAFGRPVVVPPDAQHVGAFGAALFALEEAQGVER